MAGRVATLLVDAGRHIPGRVLPDSGIIEFDDPAIVYVDDLLDDIAELVLKKRGQVVVVGVVPLSWTVMDLISKRWWFARACYGGYSIQE